MRPLGVPAWALAKVRRALVGRALVVRSVAVALVSVAGAGCTFDQQTVAVPRAQIVVHAVLNPGATQTEILVEQSLTGTATILTGQRFDSEDPIRSAGGLPISGAVVTVSGPDGVLPSVEATVRTATGQRGTGRYVLQQRPENFFAGLPRIRPGGRYTLRVQAPDGTVVTGTTTVPNVRAFEPVSRFEPFNRDRDSLALTWNVTPGARTYALRVDTPFGPFLLFSDSTRLRLPGSLRNFFAPELQRVFIPGFRQRVTLAAVDSNFFDYYRSRNDPFTGSGIINRLEGGIGLFGSAVSLDIRTLDVTQDPRDSQIEGDYQVVQTPTLPRPVADLLRLYVETPGEPAALSGWFTRNRTSGILEGLVGARVNGRIILEFLENQNTLDTVAVFSGAQSGDSLIGAYVGVPGRVVFLRRR